MGKSTNVKELSTAEYALLTGVSRVAVFRRIQRKTLPDGVTAVKIGRAYVIKIKNSLS